MTTTSREYAEALFELAAEEKLVPETSEGLELVRAAVREEPGYLALLASPAIGKDARLSALDAAFRGRIPEILLAGCDDRRALPFHRMLLNGELPLTMGGGIGQSRLCMLMMGTAHIGEVQSSLWDEETLRVCSEKGILLL